MKNGKKEGRDDWKVRRKWMKGRVEKEKRKREERGQIGSMYVYEKEEGG